MSDLYRRTARALTIDMHFPDAPFVDFARFDARREVQACLDAAVDSVHVYTKCHWGYSYYDTKVGLRHPRLKRDLVAELVPLLQQAGIEAIAYYCFWFETRTARDHPDWRVLDAAGRPVVWRQLHGDRANWRSRRWGMVCINHPEYRQRCLDQLDELFARHAFDGLMLDIVGEGFNWRYACHCPHCQLRYRERGIDPLVDRRAVVEAWCDFWAELVGQVRQRVQARRPGTALTLNGGPFRVAWRVLRQVDWPYGEGGESGHNPIVLRGCGVPWAQCGIGAGPASYDDWSADRVLLQTATAIAHGARTMFFYMTGRDPDGTFADHKYAFLARINAQTTRTQEYLIGSVPVKAVGVYHSEATLLEAAAGDDEAGPGRRLAATLDMLRHRSVPCEFVPDWRCDDQTLAPVRLLIVSEQTCLSDAEIDTFARYVQGGGHLLVCGRSGIRDERGRARSRWPLHELLGLRFEGLCERFAANGVTGYVRWTEHPFFRHLRPAEYHLWQSWPLVRAEQAERLAPVLEPLAVESDDNYLGWFPLSPGASTAFAGLTVRRLGRGLALFCVSPLAWFVPHPQAKYDIDVRWPAALLRGIIAELHLDGGVGLEGPGAVEAAFHRRAATLVVHLLNRTAGQRDGGSAPVHGVHIRVAREVATVRTARVVYPVESELAVRADGHVARVAVPPVELHTIVVLA